MQSLVFLIVILSLIFPIGGAAKILGVFSFCANSHYTLGLHLMKNLAAKGHEVTFISAYPLKEAPIKYFRDMPVEDHVKPIGEMKRIELLTVPTMSYMEQLKSNLKFGLTYTEYILRSEKVRNLFNSGEKFDLVILEHFMNEAMVIFAHKFNCPLIILSPGPLTVFNSYFMGNPATPSYVQSLLAEHGSRMTFWERLKNTYHYVFGQVFVHFYEIPHQNELMHKIYPDAPDLQTMLYNTSLLLLYSHVSVSDPAPLLVNVREVGGYHVGPPKPLPDEIKSYLDDAKEGVVVFSMGSNLKSSEFPPDKKKAILKVLSKLKYKVLWKFETELPEKSSNIKVLKWIPQQDILGHPNVIAFITHGGLLGTIEAIYHGVPLLSIPVFWDQVKNAEDVARNGIGIKLPFKDINEQNFEQALNEIVNNKQFKENVKRRSRLMRDQPVTQMDEAVFWSEYIIRNKGAPHLRSAALDLKWYQLHLLDVILFSVLTFTTPILILYLIVRSILSKKDPSLSKVNDTIKKNL